jgi:hypothetical protein
MANEYQHIRDYDGVLRYSDGATIPPDGGNRDWQEYLAWCDDGNVADPAPDPPPVIPTPDPNERITTGVAAAVEEYNSALIPDLKPDTFGATDPMVMARLDRLEQSLQALLRGQMTPNPDTPTKPSMEA